jgi:hypothetical protein
VSRAGIWRSCGAAAIVVLSLPSVGVAQDPRGYEVGLAGLATLSGTSFAGGGLTAAIRSGGRTRVVFSAFPGSHGDEFAGRAELSVQYLLTPGRMQGWSFYGSGGIAGVTGPRSNGFVMLGLGVESAPGNRSGWILEGGVGGGARISIGWRRRWLTRPPAGVR